MEHASSQPQAHQLLQDINRCIARVWLLTALGLYMQRGNHLGRRRIWPGANGERMERRILSGLLEHIALLESQRQTYWLEYFRQVNQY